MPNQTLHRLIALVTAVCLTGNLADAQNKANTINDPVFEVRKKNSKLKIVVKFAKIIKLKKRIKTVYGFDQEVISVTKVERSPNMIRVHAEKAGITSLVLVDEDRNIFTVEAFVIGDVRHLQAWLNKLFPHSSVSAVAIGDTVVLRGWVTQPEHITQMREIAETFYTKVLDQMRVGGVQQVQLKVRVMEVQRSRIRQFGFNFLFTDGTTSLGSTPGQLTPIIGFTPPSIASVTNLADPTLAFGIVNNTTVFQGFLEALKEESLLKILAEPELVTTNGRPASMLSGGEFPLLVPQSLGTTTIIFKQFGVRLEAVPIILGNGRVRLELQPEVSERDFTNSVSVGGVTVPGLTTRRVNTQVEMRFGETFMIAGLLSTRVLATTSKIPILGDLPWIGAAFRRIRYEKAETELVIMVTPELVSPMKSGQLPPGGIGQFSDDPTDRELYIDGRIEITRYGNRCEGCNVDTVFSSGPTGVPTMKGLEPVSPAIRDSYRRVYTTPVRKLPVPPAPTSNSRNFPSAQRPVIDDRRNSTRSIGDRSTTRTSIGPGRGYGSAQRTISSGSYRRNNLPGRRDDRLWDDSTYGGPVRHVSAERSPAAQVGTVGSFQDSRSNRSYSPYLNPKEPQPQKIED